MQTEVQTNRHIDWQTDRQAGKPTGRPTGRLPDRQVGRPTGRPKCRQTERQSGVALKQGITEKCLILTDAIFRRADINQDGKIEKREIDRTVGGL